MATPKLAGTTTTANAEPPLELADLRASLDALKVFVETTDWPPEHTCELDAHHGPARVDVCHGRHQRDLCAHCAVQYVGCLPHHEDVECYIRGGGAL